MTAVGKSKMQSGLDREIREQALRDEVAQSIVDRIILLFSVITQQHHVFLQSVIDREIKGQLLRDEVAQ